MPKFLVRVHTEGNVVYLVEADSIEDADNTLEQWDDEHIWEDWGFDQYVTAVEEFLKDE